ncbi:MAG: sulfotransferase [Magnetococcales bacterium]|nr:sulfotransferase [Magnetococcales bacterium]
MKLTPFDYGLARFSHTLAAPLRNMGEAESLFLEKKLADLTIDRPIFITGLARSGTTILLSILSSIPGVATHRYRDFPFLMTPYFWNRLQNLFSREEQPVERPHQDRIRITRESPDAFEEPLWHHFFPHLHDPGKNHLLDASQESPEFERFFVDHLKKIVLIRGGQRYLSKGNYNLTRIAYLAKLFPDARFLVPVRDPVSHVHSLVRQHCLFEGYAQSDPRVPHYLEAAGHFEFGPQRVPIHLSRSRTNDILGAWQGGDDYRGYAMLWADLYGYLDDLMAREESLAHQIRLVRFEQLCQDPGGEMQKNLAFAELEGKGAAYAKSVAAISPPPPGTLSAVTDREREMIWQETGVVAAKLGYHPL